MNLARFQAKPEARPLAAGGPHNGGISGSRRRQLSIRCFNIKATPENQLDAGLQG